MLVFNKHASKYTGERGSGSNYIDLEVTDYLGSLCGFKDYPFIKKLCMIKNRVYSHSTLLWYLKRSGEMAIVKDNKNIELDTAVLTKAEEVTWSKLLIMSWLKQLKFQLLQPFKTITTIFKTPAGVY